MPKDDAEDEEDADTKEGSTISTEESEDVAEVSIHRDVLGSSMGRGVVYRERCTSNPRS